VRGTLDWRILPLVGAVTFWVAGFDVLYACQDYDFDCQAGLYSIPRFIGIKSALGVAKMLHVLTAVLLFWTAWLFHLGWLSYTGAVVFAAMLVYEHSLVSHDDLSKLNAAFFTANGVVSVVFFFFVGADVLIRGVR
jgi:4-hydroxybenzoate polyprenyltransferase